MRTQAGILVLWRAVWKVHQQFRPGNSILLSCPSAKIDPFGAEGSPRVAFPGGGATTERAAHAGLDHARGGAEAGLAGTDGIRRFGVQEAVQPVLIDLRDPEELDSKLAVLAPPNCRRLDRDGGPQVCCANKDPHG